jgi:hypothetical protein
MGQVFALRGRFTALGSKDEDGVVFGYRKKKDNADYNFRRPLIHRNSRLPSQPRAHSLTFSRRAESCTKLSNDQFRYSTNTEDKNEIEMKRRSLADANRAQIVVQLGNPNRIGQSTRSGNFTPQAKFQRRRISRNKYPTVRTLYRFIIVDTRIARLVADESSRAECTPIGSRKLGDERGSFWRTPSYVENCRVDISLDKNRISGDHARH